MATQDLYIHQSVASEGSSFVIMSEDERKKKKQESELLALAAILKQLEVEVVGAKNGATAATQTTPTQEESKIVSLQAPNVNASDNTNAFQKAMAQMVLALQILQVEIAKFSNNKAGFDKILSEGEIQALQNTLKDIENKMTEMAAKAASQKTLNTILMVAEIVVAVIVTAVALVFGQVEIAALVIAMTIASATGGFQKLTDLLAKGLEKMGIPPDVAQIVAAVLVVVLVIIVTAGLAPAAAAPAVDVAAQTAAEVAAEEGGEAVEMDVMDSTNIGKVATDSSTSTATAARVTTGTSSIVNRILDAIKDFNKEYNPMSKLSLRGNLILSNATQALAQTQATDHMVNLIASSRHMSDEEKQQLEMYVTIVMECITLIVTILSAAAMSSKMSTVNRTFDESTMLGRMMTRLRSLLETSKGMIAVEGARQLVSGVADGLEAWTAALQIQQANLEMGLANDNAIIKLIQMAVNKNSEDVAASQKHEAQMLKDISTGNQSITKLFAGEEGFARLFTQYSPV